MTRTSENPFRRLPAALAMLAVAAMWQPAPVRAQQAAPPEAVPQPRDAAKDPVQQRPRPDMSDVERLRIVTDSDYPPFNYLDEDGGLTGFNVDLARTICDELAVECDIRSVEWDGLVPALEKNEADAAIASMRKTADSLERLDFTDSYYHTPARFVALKTSGIGSTRPEDMKGRRVGVQKQSAHEAYLRDFFADAVIVGFDDVDSAKEALRSGDVDVLFGDGLSLMFWLNGTSSNACCEFRGGGYSENRYFGEGVGIAVKKDDRKMLSVFNYGLELVRGGTRFEELLLRYFPLNAF